MCPDCKHTSHAGRCFHVLNMQTCNCKTRFDFKDLDHLDDLIEEGKG